MGDVPDPTHAVQLVFICQRTPDAEQADWSSELEGIVEKLAARHVYCMPVELPRNFQALFAPGAKPPSMWPPPAQTVKLAPGEVAWRHKGGGDYVTKGGVVVLGPKNMTPPADCEVVDPPEGVPLIDYRAEPIEGRLMQRDEISEGDVRFLVDLAEDALYEEDAVGKSDKSRRLQGIKARVAGAS